MILHAEKGGHGERFSRAYLRFAQKINLVGKAFMQTTNSGSVTIYAEKPTKLDKLREYAYQGNQNISRK